MKNKFSTQLFFPLKSTAEILLSLAELSLDSRLEQIEERNDYLNDS